MAERDFISRLGSGLRGGLIALDPNVQAQVGRREEAQKSRQFEVQKTILQQQVARRQQIEDGTPEAIQIDQQIQQTLGKMDVSDEFKQIIGSTPGAGGIQATTDQSLNLPPEITPITPEQPSSLFTQLPKFKKEMIETENLSIRAKSVANRINTMKLDEADILSFGERLAAGGDPAEIIKEARDLTKAKKEGRFAKGAKYIVDGSLVQARWNPKGFDELPDAQGVFRPATEIGTLATSTTNLEIGPDGSVSFKTGIGDQTIKTQSAHEREVDQGEELALESASLMKELRAEDLGFRGFFGELFIDRIAGQVFESVVNKDRVKNRGAMRALREKGLRFMTTDTRFNKADRDAVEKLFPSDGVFESLPSAQSTLLMFNEIITDRVAKSAGRLGRKPLTEMSADEIIDAVRDKKLNLGTAKRALILFHGYDE